MKKTIKNLIFISITLFSVTFTGCEKFLDSNPQGYLNQENFPVSAQDALLAVNAAYAPMRFASFHSGTFPILDIMSDDARKGSNPNDAASTIGPYDNFTFTTTSEQLASWWTTLYQAIKMSNVVINKVADIDMDATLKNRYLGEAHFLRALYYFDLVRAWGGVPLVTELIPSLQLNRSTPEKVYELIESEPAFRDRASS